MYLLLHGSLNSCEEMGTHLCSGTELECPLILNHSFFNKLPLIFLKYLINNQEYL